MPKPIPVSEQKIITILKYPCAPYVNQPILLDFDNWSSHSVCRSNDFWDFIMSRRQAVIGNAFGIVVKFNNELFGLTVEEQGLYIKGVTKIERTDLAAFTFKPTFELTAREVAYEDSNDFNLDLGNMRNAFNDLKANWNKEVKFLGQTMKILFFITSEACRFRTTRIAVMAAMAKQSNECTHWAKHYNILHNWTTIQAAQGLPENVIIDLNDLKKFASKPGVTNAQVRQALLDMNFLTENELCNDYSFLYQLSTIPEEGTPNTIVGSGYNVITGNYISIVDAKVSNPIVNMKDVEAVSYTESDFRKSDTWVTEGSTVREAMMSFNAKLEIDVNYFLFSGGVSAEFGLSSKNQYEYSYFRMFSKFISKQQYLQGEDYKKYLTSAFKRDLYEMGDIDKLFAKYGTHMIKHVLVGGRLGFSIAYHKTSSETQEKISASVNAAYGEFIKCRATSEYSSNTKYVASNSTITINTIGGEHYAMQSLELFAKNYPLWVKSLEDDRMMSACDLADISNLIPIWDLCDDPIRASKLEHRYYELLYVQTQKLNPGLEYISADLFVAMGKTDFEARKNCPQKYNMIYKNLYQNIPNKFAYLSYTASGRVGYQSSCVNLFVLCSDLPKLKEKLFDVGDRGNRYKCHAIAECINEFVENGKTFYYHLVAASYLNNPHVFAQLLQLDVLYGNTQIPKDWNYVEVATSASPANLCKGKDVEPVYLICKRRIYRGTEEFSPVHD